MRLLSIAKYIEELAMRDYYPIIESATHTYLDRHISPKTTMRNPFLSADEVGESIFRLDCEGPCAGFVEYLLDFFEKTVFYTLKTHGEEKFKGALP